MTRRIATSNILFITLVTTNEPRQLVFMVNDSQFSSFLLAYIFFSGLSDYFGSGIQCRVDPTLVERIASFLLFS